MWPVFNLIHARTFYGSVPSAAGISIYAIQRFGGQFGLYAPRERSPHWGVLPAQSVSPWLIQGIQGSGLFRVFDPVTCNSMNGIGSVPNILVPGEASFQTGTFRFE
jgi:hypothetical protein